ncbi:MAG: hypothetical protein WC508_01435 [Patescibacteria group bacterium]
MFLTIHGTAGTLIGQQTNNIWLAFILGFVFHFILDLIPHGDADLLTKQSEKYAFGQKTVDLLKKITAIDALVMISLLAVFYWQGLITQPLPVLAGVTGSILPDFIQGLYFLTKHPWLKKYFIFHSDIHFVSKKLLVSFWPGIGIQIVTLTILISVLILLK